jgi:hypothetical protein
LKPIKLITKKKQFISDLYDKPITFTIWEIVKADSIDRHSIQSIYRQLGDGLKARKGGWPTQEARKMSMTALAKRQFSLANMGLLNRRPTSGGGGRKSIYGGPNATLDVRKKSMRTSQFLRRPDGNLFVADPNNPSTGSGKGQEMPRDIILEKDFLTRLEKQASEPDVSQMNKMSRPTSGRPMSGLSTDSSRSGRDTPHPHHYNHPEKHVPADLLFNGLVKSRSLSSMTALSLAQHKTPPSPHHHTHPLNVIAPSGKSIVADPKSRKGYSVVDNSPALMKTKQQEQGKMKMGGKVKETQESSEGSTTHKGKSPILIAQE